VIANTSKKTLHSQIAENVTPGSEVFTDSLPAYTGLASDFQHQIVDHTIGQYVNGKAHTNGIENVWSVAKRGLKGTYISVEPFHLFRYLKCISKRQGWVKLMPASEPEQT